MRWLFCPACDRAWNAPHVEACVQCDRMPIDCDRWGAEVRRRWWPSRLERGDRLTAITAIAYDLRRHRRVLYRFILASGNTTVKLTAR